MPSFFKDMVMRHWVTGIRRFETELFHLHFFIGHSTFEDGNSKLSQVLLHQPPNSNMSTYCTIRKYTVLSGNILYCQEIYCTVRKYTVPSGNILYRQEIYCTVRKYTVLSGNILYCQEIYCTVRKYTVPSEQKQNILFRLFFTAFFRHVKIFKHFKTRRSQC
jgi:hypothetical protein